jgi:hypothetical protein
MSHYGNRDVMKQVGKMSQGGRFVTIQENMVGRIVTATLRPPWGGGGRKILGYFVTVDVVNTWTLHWVDVSRVSKHY